MNETWIIILSIGYFLATLSLIAALIFLIVLAIELRRGINAFKEFLESTKTKLDPAINEAEKVIHGIRGSVEDVNEVTYKIRELSTNVEKLTFIVSELVLIVEKVKNSLSLKSSALKTAVTVAANVFLENIKKGGK
ncbi:MAG: DUF948 domain-containing protein [Thermodesulfovibrio sp.]|nr:DUF948 domain-containing protein [Thermodesulfovibrio sp.]MDW7998009.1 DUF948 domain-containing protein [Thermodesulfovibrio sp.]